MEPHVYFAAGPFKKIILCSLLCFPPGYVILIIIIIIYLVIMMFLPTESQYDRHREYTDNSSHHYNGGYSKKHEHANMRKERHHVEDYNPRQSKPENVSSNDWENCSNASEESTFSTSSSSFSTSSSSTWSSSTYTPRSYSTSASSRRARAELNQRAEDRIRQEHDHWVREKQMDNSPWPSPFSSPDPPFFKMNKNQEGKPLDEVLVEVAYYQTQKQKKSTSTLNEDWWEAVIDSFFRMTKVKYDEKQIRKRLRIMRQKWKAWTEVLNKPGFGWDPVQKIIIADDKCWTAYIQINPEAQLIRRCSFSLYEELSVVFDYLGDELHKKQRNGVRNCIRVLQKMKGVKQTSESALKAIEMFQNPERREAFMTMTVEQRLVWLKGLGSIS